MTTKKRDSDEEPEAPVTEKRDRPFAPSPTAPVPTLTADEYWTRRRDLEAQLVALEIQRIESVRYPAWRYHASEPPVIVASEGAAEALGAGWAETPVETAPPAPAPPAVESRASMAHWDAPGR